MPTPGFKQPAAGQALAYDVVGDGTGGFVRAVAPITSGVLAGLPSAGFARPANTTAYASGQLVANSTAFGSVVPLSFSEGNNVSGTVRRAKLKKSSQTVTAAVFRLHLYSALPVPVNGDGGALTLPEPGYLGSFTLDMSSTNARVFSDSVVVHAVPDFGTDIVFAGQTLYGLLEARGAYVPASGETFTVVLDVLQN